MIEWKLEYSGYANYTESKLDGILKNADEIVKPCMDYFCKRLYEINNWNIDDAKMVFSEIIDEMPIFTYSIYDDNFQINYNRYIKIILIDTIKQIYREQKLNKIL